MFKKNLSFLVLLFLGLFVFLNITPGCAPEISHDAKKHMLRGEAAMETAKAALDAKNTRDFQSAVEDAVNEFKMATKYAPEWADAWVNLGVAQESAGDCAGAIASFNKYLNLSPKASNHSAIEDKIIKLEYKLEKAQKDAAAQKKEVTARKEVPARKEKEQNDTDIASRMAGIWETPVHEGQRYKVETSGNKFELFLISYDNNSRHTNELTYYGSVQNGNISGYYILAHDVRYEQTTESGRTYSCHTPAGAHPMDRGSLSPDGTRLTLHHILKDTNPNCNEPPNEIEYVFIRVQ
jgi:tetratricopeptide (TPR) repeat protein